MNVTEPRVRQFPGLAMLFMLLLGCAGSGNKPAPQQTTERSQGYSRLAAVQAGVVTTELELIDLMDLFDRYDDTYGSWLSTFELCRYHMRMKVSERARPICDNALSRAQLSGSRSAVFDTAIQLYFYRRDERLLQLCDDYADREQDRQVLALARGQYAQLSLPEDEHPRLAVRAYQYYWYGKLHSDDAALLQAYKLFAETENSQGLADVLYLRARLAAGMGEQGRARELAVRAMRVLTALGEVQKVASVQLWIGDELAAH